MSGTDSIGISNLQRDCQVSVRQRSQGGLEFLASYTYAKALSDNIGYDGIGFGPGVDPGLLLHGQQRSPPRLRAVALRREAQRLARRSPTSCPFGKEPQVRQQQWNGLKDAVLGSWTVHAIFQARTGLPVTVIDLGGQSLQATRSYRATRSPLQRRGPDAWA